MEGLLLLLTVIGTAGAGLTVVWYRDLIWPEHFPRSPAPRRPAPRRVVRGPAAGETKPKPAEAVSPTVSGVATPQTDAETVSFRTLAKLVKAGVVTETVALESACEVKAGSSKAYMAAREKLKAALAEIDKISPGEPR